MQLFENELVYIPKFYISGYNDYYFTTNNQLYNFRTKNVIRNRVKGTSSGYELNGKWITKKTIETLKIPVSRLSKNL